MKKTATITIRISQELKARLQTEAIKKSRSMSNYVHSVLAKAVQTRQDAGRKVQDAS